MTQDEKQQGIIVPRSQLSKEALDGLISEFILREGTDYGSKEISLAEKKDRIYKQLENNRILVFFEPASESTTLMTFDSLKKLSQQNYEILNPPQGF